MGATCAGGHESGHEQIITYHPGVAEGARVVNAAGSVIAAGSARAALRAVRRGVPLAEALLGAMEAVHEQYEAEEDIQHSVETLAVRLAWHLAPERYNKLSNTEKQHLDRGLKEAHQAVAQSGDKQLQRVFVPEKVVEKLDRARRCLDSAVVDIGVYRYDPQRELVRHESELLISPSDIVIGEFLMESGCRIYRGSLTLPSGSIATVAIKRCVPKGTMTEGQLFDHILKKEGGLQHQARHRSVLKLLGICRNHPSTTADGFTCRGCVLLLTPYLPLGSLAIIAENRSSTLSSSELIDKAREQLTLAPSCREAVPRLLWDVAAGLMHIHAVQPPIAHLDIKPQNILLDYRHESRPGTEMRLMPKIADFGASREAIDEHTITKEGTVEQGTMGYYSPEKADPRIGKREAGSQTYACGPHSDVFSFGMLIFFAVARTHPFAGKNEAQCLLAVVGGERPDFYAEGRTKAAYHHFLHLLAEKCWKQCPVDRPSMENVWKDLGSHVEDETKGSEHGQPRQPLGQPFWPGQPAAAAPRNRQPAAAPSAGQPAAAASSAGCSSPSAGSSARQIKYPSGDIYEGQVKDGVPHGTGKCVWADGATYTGEWRADRQHGRGTYVYADSATYTGEWREGQIHGQGTRVNASGQIDSGEFREGHMHGQGTRVNASGQIDSGEFREGHMHGQGKLTKLGGTEGNEYEGQLAQNKFHGRGKYVYADGTSYTGEYREGKWHGQGKCVFADGATYTGEYREGNFHGQGTHVWASGATYTGEWREGHFHGRGTLTYPSGRVEAGRFEHHKFMGP